MPISHSWDNPGAYITRSMGKRGKVRKQRIVQKIQAENYAKIMHENFKYYKARSLDQAFLLEDLGLQSVLAWESYHAKNVEEAKAVYAKATEALYKERTIQSQKDYEKACAKANRPWYKFW